mgnify:FL=1
MNYVSIISEFRAKIQPYFPMQKWWKMLFRVS